MMKFVTVFGTDPEAISTPEPLKPVPPTIRIVDKKGAVVFSVSPSDDHDELVANMTAINADLAKRAVVASIDGPEPAIDPIPDLSLHYQGLLYRWKLSLEIHNGQFPDDPWALQEEQDVPDPPVAQAEVKG